MEGLTILTQALTDIGVGFNVTNKTVELHERLPLFLADKLSDKLGEKFKQGDYKLTSTYAPVGGRASLKLTIKIK